MAFWDGSGICWTICKQSAPHSRQITTSTTHRSIFTGWMLFLMANQQCQSTEGGIECTARLLHREDSNGTFLNSKTAWICDACTLTQKGKVHISRQLCLQSQLF